MFNRNPPNHRKVRGNPSGFTLAEMLIATAILLILIGTATAISSNFFNSLRNIQAANTVYDEANFTMERLTKEIQNGTVDYEEYYNQANFRGLETNETYGQNYCQYSRQFYAPGPDGKYGTFDDESTGVRNAGTPTPINAPIQKKLYLIDSSGTHRTYVERVDVQKIDGAGKPYSIGKVAILKLDGKDYGINHLEKGGNPLCKDSGEGDGLIDTWVCAQGFKCSMKEVQSTVMSKGLPIDCSGTLRIPLDYPGALNNVDTKVYMDDTSYEAGIAGQSSFVDITPDTIDVVSLDFIVTPHDDPRKAYNDIGVQIQPNVTLKMTVRAAAPIASTFKGSTPTIVLESTVSARATKEIVTECNLQQCIDGDVQPCPKHTGLLAQAKQTCFQGVWPGCVETCDPSGPYRPDCYTSVAAAAILSPAFASVSSGGTDGLDHNAAFTSPRSFYESSSEIGSCVKKDANGTEVSDDDCKRRRCNDGVDNDANGKTDQEDPACLYYLCNNGYLDPGEKCIDVGGPCEFIHPFHAEDSPALCTDGYDNDCNYNFDLKWDDINNNSPQSSQVVTPDQRIRAIARGASSNSTTAELNIDLGQGADEYDQNCIDKVFCVNNKQDVGIFGPKDPGDPPTFTPNYLLPLSDKPISKDLDEACVDIGGLCEWTTDGKHRKVDKEYDPSKKNELVPNATDPKDIFNNELLTLVSTGALCHDRLDNDCNFNPNIPGTGPDEFDASCKAWICSNGVQDCSLASPPTAEDLASPDFNFVSYLKNSDIGCLKDKNGCCANASPLNETCKNVGGLCGGAVEETKNKGTCVLGDPNINCMCFDGIDNDCGNGIDGVINSQISLFSPSAAPDTPMADQNCCTDTDGDGFAHFDTNTCHPAKVGDDKSNSIGFIDCNDVPSNDKTEWHCPDAASKCLTTELTYPAAAQCAICMFPGAPEVCGDNVDSDCSGVNLLDHGTDNEEPSCCMDLDGDGFGIATANLPNESADPKRCMGSTSINISSDRTTFDCKDTDPNISPAIKENTKALCSDGIDNSCRYVGGIAGYSATPQLEMKDHIDMYATGADATEAKASLLAAYNAKKFNPDCCASNPEVDLTDFYGDSAAAHHRGMEICDDNKSLLAGSFIGSDENCNGLEGYDDNYCVGSDEQSFFDNLSSEDYLINGYNSNPLVKNPPVVIDTSLGADGQRGRIKLETSANETETPSPTVGDVASKSLPLASTCQRVATVGLNQNADLPNGPDGITYQVSNDGGANWSQITPGGPMVALNGGGKDLRWWATLTRPKPTDGIAAPSPTLNSVTIKWTCD